MSRRTGIAEEVGGALIAKWPLRGPSRVAELLLGSAQVWKQKGEPTD